MTHPLDHVFARLARTDEHLADLKRRCDAFIEEQRKASHLDFKSQEPSQPRKLVAFPDTKPPLILRVIVGEIAYNLRSALDYLIYALAEHDSGQPQTGTQCPIVDTPEDFERHKKTWLRGVSAPHIAVVEQLQPYHGRHWIRLIRDLSNPDKHRRLTVLRSEFTAAHLGRMIIGGEGLLVGEPTTIEGAHFFPWPFATARQMYVEAKIEARVSLDDGTPVVEILQLVKSQVSYLVEIFKPEFK